MSKSVGEIALAVGGKVIGDELLKITHPSAIENAGESAITFLSNEKYAQYLSDSQASCIIVPEGVEKRLPAFKNRSYIVTPEPYRAFVQVLKEFVPPVFTGAFKAGSAHIAPGATIHENSFIDENCSIGENCTIGEGAVLKANVVLYDNVSIGAGTLIHANVTCYNDTRIGSGCIIHAGAVIGSDGFGNLENPDGSWEKIPQIGNVIIGDNVEIGANTTIDRATLGSTIIEDGVKLDNLIHIAHNVIVGKNTAMAAQAGISGSAVIGARNRVGGQVGIAGHLATADDVMILAQSGVSRSIRQKGEYFGSPAKDMKVAFRQEAATRQLPELLKEFSALKKSVEALLKKNEDL